jgi:hypothetical protein
VTCRNVWHRHMQMFPEDGVTAAVENILSFESFSPRTRSQIAAIFRVHGIPIPSRLTDSHSLYGPSAYGINAGSVRLAVPESIPESIVLNVTCTDAPTEKVSLSSSRVAKQEWGNTTAKSAPFNLEASRLFTFRYFI